MDTLIIGPDGSPVSFIPLSTVPWQEAMRLVFSGKAKPILFYQNRVVRTINQDFQVPSVIMTPSFRKKPHGLRFNRRNVFIRDGHRCQLCGNKFDESELTIDHVYPRSFGGEHVWTNVTTACMACNSRKGNNINVLPINKPYRPTYYDLIKIKKREPIYVSDIEWNQFLQWPIELVKLKEIK